MFKRLTLAAVLLALAPITASAYDLTTSLSANASYPSGTATSFPVQVRNLGPDSASAVTASIRFTALSGNINVNSEQVTASAPGFTCGSSYPTAQGPTIDCTAPSLAAGYSGQFTYGATITGSSGNMNICASIQPTAADADSANNSSCKTITVTVAQADLAVSASSTSSSPIPSGSTAPFTSSIRNDGPDAASNASLAVRFTALSGPVTFTGISTTQTPSGFTCGSPVASAQGPTVTCSAPTVSSGYTGAANLVATINSNGGTGQFEVCSSFTSATSDPDTNGQSNFSCVTRTYGAAVSATTGVECGGTIQNGSTQTGAVYVTAPQSSDIVVTLTSSNPAVATVPAQVTIPAGTSSVQFTITAVGAGSTTITATPPPAYGSAKTCLITVPQNASVTTTLGCPSAAATVGVAQNGTVTISASQSSNTVIALTSSNPAVFTVPATVTIPAGATSATFPVTFTGVGSATITATPRTGFGTAQQCTLTVSGPTLGVTGSSGACPMIVAQNGGTGSGIVTIGAAQSSPVTVTLSSSNPAVAAVPASVTIPAGSTSATFTITGGSAGTATITATLPANLGGGNAQCSVSAQAVADVPLFGPLGTMAMVGVLALCGLFVTRRAM